MATDRQHQITALYHAALERDGRERAAFLGEACAGDDALRREVESLLGYEDAAGAFLERPALEEAAPLVTSHPDSGGDLVGRRLGVYQIEARIGAGGMGEVYRARDVKLGREVALKVLARSVTGDPAYLRRFEEEARFASVLNHPNIVTIYGVGEEGDIAYIAMEVVRGRTLREVLAGHPLRIGEVLDIAAPLADALAAAHARGIVHRDLKPENVMITSEGLLKVLDFGLAKRPREIESLDRAQDAVATHAVLTLEGMILGTVGYMSPEQAAGRPAGLASDQFSFGVILYEMICGRQPFERDTAVETLSATIREQPPAIQTLNPALSLPIQQIVERCLAKAPADRYADTRQLAVQLREIRDRWDRGSESGPALVLKAPFPLPAARDDAVRPAGSVSRRRALWVAGAAVASVAAGFWGWQRWLRDTGIRVLAVLPFVNAAKEDDIEYLCDGITESLIQQISRLPLMTVIARSTVFNFKNSTDDPREALRGMNVHAILTGTVTSRSGRLVITAELADMATGVRLWGNTYERAADQVLSVQDDIVNNIMDEGIRLRLTGDQRRQLARHLTADPVAFQLYMRARYAVENGAEEGVLEASKFLADAIARDPEFASAHAFLAGFYVTMVVDGYERPANAWLLAKASNSRALKIDPELPAGHAIAGNIAFFDAWDWPTAKREFEIAMKAPSGLLPTNEVLTYPLLRWALGAPADAVQIMRRIREADPLTDYFAVFEADFVFHSGSIDEAVTLYEATIQKKPSPNALFGLAEARHRQGRFDEAIAVRRSAHQARGDDVDLGDVLETARGAEGYRQIERRAARLDLDRLLSRHQAGGYASPLDFARAYAKLGDVERAFKYFDPAFDDHDPGLVFLKADRAWDGIRDDPRFKDAVRRVRLP